MLDAVIKPKLGDVVADRLNCYIMAEPRPRPGASA